MDKFEGLADVHVYVSIRSDQNLRRNKSCSIASIKWTIYSYNKGFVSVSISGIRIFDTDQTLKLS